MPLAKDIPTQDVQGIGPPEFQSVRENHLAVLTSKQRKAMPKAEFALPAKKAYPVPDKSHAANAKARATEAVNAGRMSEATKAKIDAKANAVLRRNKGGPVNDHDGDERRPPHMTHDPYGGHNAYGKEVGEQAMAAVAGLCRGKK